ncbi:DNA-directed RNA polymerase subunit beta [bacterium]|nr:DNA-directed RNA polymerase subunit beta [bacterium]
MNFLIERRVKLAEDDKVPLRNLLDIQTNSFENFCFEGIREVFDEVFPIVSNDEEFELDFDNYYITTPELELMDCFEQDKTHSGTLRGIFSFVNRKTGEIKEQEVYIAEMPFMTPAGTFVINGVERVIVSQLVRSPGVYFTHGDKRTSGEDAFMAKVIPYRGAWLKYEYDKKNSIYQVRIDSPRRVLKVPITTFFKALGFEIDNINHTIYYPDNRFTKEQWPNPQLEIKDTLHHTLERDFTRNTLDAQKEIWRKLHPTEPFSKEVLSAMLPSRFFDEKRYDLAKVGRYVLNEKLGLKIPADIRTLTHADLLEAFRLLHDLQEYNEGEIDDVEHLNLENRRVEHIGELLQAQFRRGLLRVERIVKEKMMMPDIEKESPKTLLNTRPLIGVLKEFFGSSQMSQFMDNTNPLTSLTHKRRLSALGPKGLTRESARFDFRDVHHSHYGRVCPIESPEGPNIGLISSLATYARVDENGFVITPFLEVKNGVIQKDKIVYLTATKEKGYRIAPSTTALDKSGKIVEDSLFVRHRSNFEVVSSEKVDLIEVSPMQFISVTTSLIPFLEHDDANRALMGSNMQRQAVPLLFPESPLVGTGSEMAIARDAGSSVRSQFCGRISHLDSKKINIEKGIVCDAHSGEILDFPNLEAQGTGEVLNRNKFEYIFSAPTPHQIIHTDVPFEDRKFVGLNRNPETIRATVRLRKFQRSNQGTLIDQRVRVTKGAAIIKGDLLADTASTDNGELALGRNILVAFLPWRGYNFEDAVVVSERLVKEEFFTSLHIEKHECEARQTKLGPEKLTREVLGLAEEYIEKNLDERGIIRVGAEVKSGDVLVGKITPKGESDLSGEEKLIRAVFGDKGKGFKNSPLKVPHGQEGVVIRTQYFSRKDGVDLTHNIVELARVYVAKKKALKVGDKVAGRHGNKGVISIVVPAEDMPFLPDGKPVDVVLNPLGVPNRMNIGQVLETHLGLACGFIDQSESSEIIKLLERSKDIPLEKSKDRFNLKINEIHTRKIDQPMRICSPVFRGISEEQIRVLFDHLGLPLDGKTVLFDGVTGEPFKERVLVGMMYIMKLNHLVDDKMHARSTGSYALITQQPLGGKAQFGGQRLGEMEVWALEGYGAAYLLKEMLTSKSDDVSGRNATYKAIVDGKMIPEPGIPESFNVIVNELKSLGLDVNVETDESELKAIFEDRMRMRRRPKSFADLEEGGEFDA